MCPQAARATPAAVPRGADSPRPGSVAWPPPGTPPLLAHFHAAGVLGDAEVDVAPALARLTGERDPEVTLAAALAVRAPRVGHVCVDLARVRHHVVTDASGRLAPEDVDELPWPDPQAWAEAVAASPMVGDGARPTDPGATRPLVWHEGRLYLDRYWRYEQSLAEELRSRAGDPAPGAEPDAVAAALGPPSGKGAVERQRLAVAAAAIHRLAVITGGPGTGKTTTVVRLLATLLELAGSPEHAPRIALAAPTGKAARRLTEAILAEAEALTAAPWAREVLRETTAVTVHRLLGVRPDHRSRFRHHRARPLPHDVVIVDEASMVSLPLMAKLVEAVRPDARLTLVGDRDQLASVEAGAVLGDVCGPGDGAAAPEHSAEVVARLDTATGQDVRGAAKPRPHPGIWDAVVRLSRFHRFGEGSDIGRAAHAIRALGDDPTPAVSTLAEATARGDAAVRWHTPGVDDLAPRALIAEIVAGYEQVVRHAERGEAAAALDALGAVRVLCAHREGPGSAAWWNQRVATELAERGRATGSPWFAGRPVLVTENDYDLELFNGDVGVVVASASAEPGRVDVAFPGSDGAPRRLAPSRLPAHETTFATTVHKAQGSQYGHAVVVLPERDSPVCTRELVYTALTRARTRVSLLTDADVLTRALARRIQRPSGLHRALWGT